MAEPRTGRSRQLKPGSSSTDNSGMSLLDVAAAGPETQPNKDRWFSVGRSLATESSAAAAEAVAQALTGAASPHSAALAIVFATPAHANSVLLGQLAELLPGVEVIGCSTAGEIAVSAGDQFVGNDSLVVALLGGSGFAAKTARASMLDAGELRERAAEAATIAHRLDHPYRALLALTDGMATADQCEVVRGVYEAIGAAVPLVGGCAGDGLRFDSTTQLHGTDAVTGSLVLGALGSDSPIGIGVAHGWRRVGDPMFVTAVDGTQVVELDHRPAVDVYLERLGADPSIGQDADRFTDFSLTHPLALVRRRGDEIRWVTGADIARRSLKCSVEMQRSAQVWLTEGDCQSTVDAVGAACNQAIAQLNGARPIGAIAFNCAARRIVLGSDGLRDEVAQIAHHLGDIPVTGFYTYGEFARVQGPHGFHNQTLVMMVFS